METIRKDLATLAGVLAFDSRHPWLKPDAIAIAGPFESREKAAHQSATGRGLSQAGPS